MYFLSLVTAFFMLSTLATADEAKSPTKAKPKKLVCKSAADVRVIQTEPKGEKGCEVLYTKGDAPPQSVASAQHESEICEGVVNKIKNSLINAGFKCE